MPPDAAADPPPAAGTERADEMLRVREGPLRVGEATEAIVLLLHGGRAVATMPTRWRDVSYLRMVPFERAVRRMSRGRVATTLVHNRDGGWVASDGSGVRQCRALISGLVQAHQLPVILLGHSSGGWVALRSGGDPGVAGVVALAPWVGEQDSVTHLTGTPVRVVHGTADHVCSPARAEELVERARRAGGDATFTAVPGGDHAMLRGPSTWHRLAASAVVALLDSGSPPNDR